MKEIPFGALYTSLPHTCMAGAVTVVVTAGAVVVTVVVLVSVLTTAGSSTTFGKAWLPMAAPTAMPAMAAPVAAMNSRLENPLI
jgi:NADH:ubiquinone oxidoreductase subunit 6 (subunit J)